MDGSKRSARANAFFTGLGKTRKIALYDTLLEKCTDDEIVAVLAHEIGHFRCGHIPRRLVAGWLQLGGFCFLLGMITDPHGPWGRMIFDAFGVDGISAALGLVLFGIMVAPVSMLLGILSNAWSRKHEFEADAYAVRVTGAARELATALCRLTSDHMSHPTPSRLSVILDASHPPLLQRLDAIALQNGGH